MYHYPIKKVLVGKKYSTVNELRKILHPSNKILRNGRHCKIITANGQDVNLNLDEHNYLIIESPESVVKVTSGDYVVLDLPNTPNAINVSKKGFKNGY